jgi:hypothetical protein
VDEDGRRCPRDAVVLLNVQDGEAVGFCDHHAEERRLPTNNWPPGPGLGLG